MFIMTFNEIKILFALISIPMKSENEMSILI